MKLWIACATMLAFAGCMGGRTLKGQRVKTPDTLRILSYNIHHANPPSRPEYIDLDAIARVINEQRPDFVALQEVDVRTGRSGKDVDQAAVLARKTGMHSFFAKAIPYDGGEYGVAVLSRYPVKEGRAYALPSVPGVKAEQRALCTVAVTLPDGREVMMASTHLDVTRSDSNRVLQTREISRILGQAGMPVILAGDMNAKAGSRAISILDSTFTRTCTECPFTIPVDTPKRAIDFIMYAPASVFRVIGHQVITERYASDHLPVLATLVF
ncbi:endonuclease/exonuclease/phosphatase family protein [Chitinophaga rhizophila]|uniref:Endonuclease/exonuclease/phosphatase family protein n=1 Tax=Chitinophaga rhizophila TaxID=2866212 RepID=A0ABS7GH11_9BACT|nr:endonuclease/exonuclease/phosphatase family protein [Chitinophaga rhizophila]MBW8686420.1 endonuclease/exonuclease/phosphatase family protein [Chitinophaga rhizophila]